MPGRSTRSLDGINNIAMQPSRIIEAIRQLTVAYLAIGVVGVLSWPSRNLEVGQRFAVGIVHGLVVLAAIVWIVRRYPNPLSPEDQPRATTAAEETKDAA